MTSDDTEVAQDHAEQSDEADSESETLTAVAGAEGRGSAVAFGVLPVIALSLAALAGFLRWQEGAYRAGEIAADESVAAARQTAETILSYKADTAEQELNTARDRLTGSFLDEYTKLINEVVIPGAKEKKITAVAQVPAAASVSASAGHATALVFVNQSITMGKDAPTTTASSVRVTLDKVGGRWLVSGFEPV